MNNKDLDLQPNLKSKDHTESFDSIMEEINLQINELMGNVDEEPDLNTNDKDEKQDTVYNIDSLFKKHNIPEKSTTISYNKIECQKLLDDYLSKYTYTTETLLSSKIHDFIYSRDGNKHFKTKEFKSLPQGCFQIIYETVENKFITLLRHHYSSYFSQHLFFLLNQQSKNNILIEMCDKIDTLYKNSNGQCSIIFILENNLSDDERQLIMTKLKPNLPNLIWKPMFMRVAECLIVRCPSVEKLSLIEYCIANMLEFIKIREGYFLIRIIIKSAKTNNLQSRIIQYINNQNNFFNLSNCLNGSLLLQCIIYNFPLESCYFEKSCSKHMNKEEAQEKINHSKSQKINNNNNEVKRLMKIIINNSNYWDHKFVKQVVECAIKKSPSFEQIFIQIIANDHKLILDILSLNSGPKYFELMFSNFLVQSNNIIVSLVKNIVFSNEKNGVKNNTLTNFFNKYKNLLITIETKNDQIQQKVEQKHMKNSNTLMNYNNNNHLSINLQSQSNPLSASINPMQQQYFYQGWDYKLFFNPYNNIDKNQQNVELKYNNPNTKYPNNMFNNYN